MTADLISEFKQSEMVIGLVGAVGAKLEKVSTYLRNKLEKFGYKVIEISVSEHVIPMFVDTSDVPKEKGYDRTSKLMDAGNKARKEAKDNSILAMGIATRIHRLRELDNDGNPKPRPKTAYVVNSLKRPEEVKRLKDIYGAGFYLIAAHNDYEKRMSHLTDYLNIAPDMATILIERDFEEKDDNGQRVNRTFALGDFFIRVDASGDNDKNLKNEIDRISRIIFGHPFTSPTFDEYAMFFAFSASLRSADLSRQVGAVIAKNNQVLGHGANDCPAFGGGLYWPIKDENGWKDAENGRDYMRETTRQNGEKVVGFDSNDAEKAAIVEELVKRGVEKGLNDELLRQIFVKSPIDDLTEFGRVVHAEMDALLSCSRASISTADATIYSTTFPCHNCAKHIVAAGIKRVVYIEPYPKSKALDFHTDSIYLGFQEPVDKVHFEPFVGVGPRRFFDLFSCRHGSGRIVERKDAGFAKKWTELTASLRLQMTPFSYLDLEELALDTIADTLLKGIDQQ